MFDCLVVGAGFAGSVVAERVASELGHRVLLVERRDHIAGNSYDYKNESGLFVQKYGPHIFHTNSRTVWDYLSGFTQWNDYQHRVLAFVRDQLVSLPINQLTLEQLYGRSFTAEEMREFLEERKVPLETIDNSKDVIISQVGEELYELFFKNYTKKQWGVYPEELDAEVTKRLPVRFNRDDRYFADRYQGLPKDGFTRMFQNMLNHPNITVRLGTEFKDVPDLESFKYVIFTGAIDEFFNYKFGALPYRSLRFDFQTLDRSEFQPAAVVNYPNQHDFTRITEFKKFYQQSSAETVLCYEYPQEEGDPYYPVPRKEPKQVYEKYQEEAESLGNVFFVGRLAQYRYMNMDQVVESALDLAASLKSTYAGKV